MTTNIKSSDTVLGYTLLERIGSGGYGEVWSAIAPGGLKKAVKFVYGYHDEKRAQTEIKALDRVKELRHPFLLSLERIEIHEGQLVIVSELADCCLADVFNSYVAKGEPGVPRDELLVYIRDAADALDYLAQTHSLQHLDVKPENLLIVSGHVKVADFGLVKELNVTAQSMMTGMTPAYAAPELFDGQPGERSDQYSLAIVYQEMLTSMRPFTSTTAAQLAAQHMHGRPNLRMLPKGDQPVIAKALSKDPNVRFQSCREMVEELLNKKLRKKSIRRLDNIRSDEGADTNTVQIGEANRDVTAVVSSNSLPYQSASIQQLGPPDLNGVEPELQPTIIVAVGNTASQSALRFKQRVNARHGSAAALPAVKVICVDTDRQALSDLANRRGVKMEESELLSTPLRKPEVYRNRGNTHLSWLSRRWIYNIPRSLQTEGLRPLGRLAFADHFDDVCRRLREAIETAVQVESIAATSEATGLNPGKTIQPRVFVVGSPSGGVGGMLLDLAYTARALLIENGVEPKSVFGVLFHAANRRSRDAGLAAANTFSLLSELRHFTESGYPGDENLGLPEFPDDPPFDEAYYLDLGFDLGETEYHDKLDSVAEWLYLNTLSPCSVFFDACRAITQDSEHFDLRTFGLSISGPGHSNAGLFQAKTLASLLIERWLQGSEADLDPASQKAASLFEEYDVHLDGVMNQLDDELQESFGEQSFDALKRQAEQVLAQNGPGDIASVKDLYDSIFGIPAAMQEVGYEEPELVPVFRDAVGHLGLQLGELINNRMTEMISPDRLNLNVPTVFVSACRQNLESLLAKIDAASSGCEQQLTAILQQIAEVAQNPKQQEGELSSALELYQQFRHQSFLLRSAKEFCHVVRNTMTASETLLEKYRELLADVRDTFSPVEFEPNLLNRAGFNFESLVLESVEASQSKLLDRMELQLVENVISKSGGFQQYLNESYNAKSELPERMSQIAIQIVTDAYKMTSIGELLAASQRPFEELCKWLTGQIANAHPEVRNCGGGMRLMVGIPQFNNEETVPELIKHVHGDAVPIQGTAGDLVMCYEGEEISLAGVAFRLLETRPDAAELSKRIHCRKDVEWSSLIELL